uniref:Laminin EGF-like domain-containing protein n=2 Tax=Amphimedon queenslandica TaxID=400682 RepID=A0A1X7VPN4_AMPQE
QNEWRTLSLPGLPSNASRYSYSAVSPDNTTLLVYGGFKGSTFHDVLMFRVGRDCSEYDSVSSCSGSLCRWFNNSTCTDISLEKNIDTGSYCHLHISCLSCNTSSSTDCHWINNKCQYVDPTSNTTAVTSATAVTSNDPSCSESRPDSCSHYLSCVSCVAHEACGWTQTGCTFRSNDTITSCSVIAGCSGHSSCSSCRSQQNNNCLWCSSLNKCVNTGVYPYLFPFGQCLGWTQSCSSVTEDCSDHLTCAECRTETGCGWCRDESDTGLGTCGKGGFLKSLNGSFCVDTHWFYDTCPLCNCNGHSECINQSVCLDCQNNTRGANCESCEDGYFGRPVNGRSCSVCDCNGYNTVCDNSRGNCTCLDAGVTGSTCTLCKAVENYRGNASNFCYYSLSVGFIYTFLSPDVETQNFFVARPRSSSRLNVKFEISRNRFDSSISVQYFLGRSSQNYAILYNVTDVLTISGTNSHSERYESFSSVTFNSSNLFSFARPDIQSTAQFGWLFGNSSSNDFTSNLWDGDVGLVIYVFNLKPDLQYKITVDQNDLTFLIYFFVTFLTCFTFLLSLFLLGWYIKRKLEIRALIRAQHIEMQRRVRRPFARIKAIVDTPLKSRAKQTASYVAVETVNDSKAAILSVLIRLPCDKATGHPKPNRTGMCFGSTFVRMNPPKKKRTKHSSSNHNTNT